MKPSMSQVNADSPISEDQLEVREYLASSRYQRAKSTSWQRERMVANIEVGESKSLFMGIGGLATFVLVFGAAMPLGMELVNQLFTTGRPKFALMMIIFQTLLYPPVVCFAFATVTPMFWYGSVFLRFAMASFAVLPGCFALAGWPAVERQRAPGIPLARVWGLADARPPATQSLRINH